MDDLAAWAPFGIALVAFLASHAIPARPPVRRRLTALLGERLYLALYSLLSIVLLVWLVHAAAGAPFVELWSFADWQRHVPALMVPIGFAIGAAGLFSPNPLSMSASRRRFDASRPGVVALTRHPVLMALALWTAAHIVPNGDLAHLILFGTFLLLSVGGMFVLDRRARRRLGEAKWASLAQHYRLLQWPRGRWLDRRTVLLGLAGVGFALAFAFLHEAVIGVPALAP